ncbi:hypothetical protein PENTCL1PPCAC_21733, partial [Pristionchus entomophagus]
SRCRIFAQPYIFHELFPNVILIDQSSWIAQGLKEGYTAQKTAFIANCRDNECTNRANELSLQNFTSSKPQVSCFIHQSEHDSVVMNPKNLTCRGDFCYTNYMDETTPGLYKLTRGCITIVEDD